MKKISLRPKEQNDLAIVDLALLVLLFFLGAVAAHAQTPTYAATQGFCQVGGIKVVTQGMNSTTTVQASYPKCQVKVYLTGTLTLQTIYSDKGHSSPLPNPFTASTAATWAFYSQEGQSIDIVLSGGTPQSMPQPVTLADVSVGGGGGGGGGAIPAGATNEVNAKLDPATFQGSGLFTNTAHTFMNVPVAQWAQAQVNAPPNTLCGGRGCGIITNYGQNLPNNDGNGNLTGFAQAYYNFRNALYTGQGMFNGFSNNPDERSGGNVTKFQNDQVVFQSDGITQWSNPTVYCSKPHDCASFYTYVFNHGGLRTGGDEGITPLKIGGGNDFRNQGQGPVTGSPVP
ncbi:MAG TPA: hypothetical protein VK638_06310, partial [Edaphobacter sp.]|nr:hypothetical protein [Edaphobacter sp.]